MRFDDAVNTARAKRAADAARADDRDAREEREREAGRQELASLVSEAWRVLSESGPPPAVEAVRTVRKRLFGGPVVRFKVGRTLRLLGSSGLAITGPGELLRVSRPDAAALHATGFLAPSGAAVALVQGAETMVESPSSYEDQFYVKAGELVYGYAENPSPSPAATLFAQWVAESLDGP